MLCSVGILTWAIGWWAHADPMDYDGPQVITMLNKQGCEA